MKKTLFYLGSLFLLGMFIVPGNVSQATTTTSSAYNDKIIRAEFNFSAVLNNSGDVDMTWESYAPEGFNYYKYS